MAFQTNISNILDKNDPEEYEEIDQDNLPKIIMDFSLTTETRIKAIDIYFTKNIETDESLELINKISSIYEMSGTKNLRNYLFNICEKSKINPLLKIICAKALNSFDEKDILGYKAIDMICNEIYKSNISTLYKIDIIKILMKNDEYNENSKKYFCEIINDQKISCDYRFKTIFGLENSEKDLNYFIKEGLLYFFFEEKNEIKLRIMSCQTLLKKYQQYQIEDILYSICENTEYSENVRADACDTLLYGGTDEYKEKAKIMIMKLGNAKNVEHIIYGNSQNVHIKEIEKSVSEGIEFLNKFELMKHEGKNINFSYVEEKIFLINLEKNVERIKICLNRILIDKCVYSDFNCTLLNILLRIWTYISSHKDEEEMKKRLLEELDEMADTCSSGFVSRLINVISGFGEFNLQISWRDQIIANFSGRLNKEIRDLDDLTLQDKILAQMTLKSDDYEKRKHFLKFLRNNLLKIRFELYSEFKNHICDTDFDLYFRSAVSQYEIASYS